MTRITYKGQVYIKISKSDWEFGGGPSNPDLLKLKNKHWAQGRRSHCYFRLRGTE